MLYEAPDDHYVLLNAISYFPVLSNSRFPIAKVQTLYKNKLSIQTKKKYHSDRLKLIFHFLARLPRFAFLSFASR